jgi:leader peptidase (prepilin peptidase) / N-methyltransferase
MRALAAALPGHNSVPTRFAVQFGVMFLALCCVLKFGASAKTVPAVFFVTVLVVLSAVDIERRILPNVILLPATAVLFVMQLVLFPESAVEIAIAGLGAALFLLLLLAVYPQGMGMGDVKLALFLGVGLGSDVAFALLAGALAGSAVSVALLLYHCSAARKMAIPFGPCLALGAIVALFGGQAPFLG